ncbi:MAG: DUF2628 domain-containing protein [Desulfobacterales bacterium]|nr:DUF2628 domain-containing protein [Desulfobacterales bacterium]
MIDDMDHLYEIVGQELKKGEERPGLMARAVLEADGDPNRAKSLYIKYRIEQLRENSKQESLKEQTREVETFLADYEDFPLFVSAIRKVLPQLGPVGHNGKLKKLKGKIPNLFYQTAHYLYHTKYDVPEATRYYSTLIDKFPRTREAEWSSQELNAIERIHQESDPVQEWVIRTETDEMEESRTGAENVLLSDNEIIESGDPIDGWFDRPPVYEADRELSLICKEISDEELKLFIGKRSAKYLGRFKKFRKGRVRKYSITWHWPAFFAGFCWMFYRKLYGWGLIDFVLSLLPGVCLITRPIFAMTANYLLYNKATRSILSLKGSQETSDDTPSLKEAIESRGGVDSWIPCVAIPLIIIHILIATAILMMAVVIWPILQRYFR